MNVTKTALLLVAIAASAPSMGETPLEWQWAADGGVRRGGERLETSLQSVTTALATAQGLFVGGYRLAADGENQPYIALVPVTGKTVQHWPQPEASVQQFFAFQTHTFLLLGDGRTKVFGGGSWQPADIVLEPGSIIVATTPDLIACHAESQREAEPAGGGRCFKVDGGWSTPLNWSPFRPRPAICQGDLVVIVATHANSKWQLAHLDPASGKEISRVAIHEPEPLANICTLATAQGAD